MTALGYKPYGYLTKIDNWSYKLNFITATIKTLNHNLKKSNMKQERKQTASQILVVLLTSLVFCATISAQTDSVKISLQELDKINCDLISLQSCKMYNAIHEQQALRCDSLLNKYIDDLNGHKRFIFDMEERNKLQEQKSNELVRIANQNNKSLNKSLTLYKVATWGGVGALLFTILKLTVWK